MSNTVPQNGSAHPGHSYSQPLPITLVYITQGAATGAPGAMAGLQEGGWIVVTHGSGEAKRFAL